MKVNYACCVRISHFRIIAYKIIFALSMHKMNDYKINFDLKSLLYKELTPYESLNFTSFDCPI